MFLVAVALIFLGLVCLLAFFVSLAVTRTTETVEESEVPRRNLAADRPIPSTPPVWRPRASVVTDGSAAPLRLSPAKRETKDLIVSGILFLDPSRRVKDEAARTGELSPDLYAGIKRMGQGTLVVQGSDFLIQCANATYRYSAADLDQILFVRGGVALIPYPVDQPIPVFITERHEEIREFIRSHSKSL